MADTAKLLKSSLPLPPLTKTQWVNNSYWSGAELPVTGGSVNIRHI